jgi:hypothetical protein
LLRWLLNLLLRWRGYGNDLRFFCHLDTRGELWTIVNDSNRCRLFGDLTRYSRGSAWLMERLINLAFGTGQWRRCHAGDPRSRRRNAGAGQWGRSVLLSCGVDAGQAVRRYL